MPPPGKREGQTYGLAVRANMLLPGLYAWVTTVAYPTTYRGAAASARITAFIALIALISGPLLVMERPRLARILGIHVFLGFSLVTWVLLGTLISVDRLEPVRSALGAVGWALFALGWGTVRRPGSVPEDDPHVLTGPPLSPRNRLPTRAAVVLAISLAGVALPLLLAWRVVRSEHALLAHAAALLSALIILNAGSSIALSQGASGGGLSVRQRVASITRPLALLTLLLLGGLLALLLR
ncbi:MAG TPA: hypothetical protein VK524_17060 [Polyangiaceae bacterium]|nr:hypothetical protein [Polyangiaceae bacterium]